MFIDIVHPKLTNAYNAKTLVPNLNYILFSLISEKMIEMINFQFRIYLAEFLNLYTFANPVSIMLTSRYTFIRNFTFIRTAILAIGLIVTLIATQIPLVVQTSTIKNVCWARVQESVFSDLEIFRMGDLSDDFVFEGWGVGGAGVEVGL